MSKPNLIEIYARRLLNKPNEWVALKYQVLGDGPNTHFQVTGAICPKTYGSGPRKGQTNYSKNARHDEAYVVFSETSFRKFELDWEEETGLCLNCGDSGQQLKSYNETLGEVFGPCTRCNRGQELKNENQVQEK